MGSNRGKFYADLSPAATKGCLIRLPTLLSSLDDEDEQVNQACPSGDRPCRFSSFSALLSSCSNSVVGLLPACTFSLPKEMNTQLSYMFLRTPAQDYKSSVP